MLRHVLTGLAAVTLVCATLAPDEASARRGGGARVGAVGGARVGAVGGRAYVSRPIARPGVGYGRYAGGRYGYRGVGLGVGAAAVGAAAAGAAYYGNGYYGNSGDGCYQDSYGRYVCPNQYQGQYQYHY